MTRCIRAAAWIGALAALTQAPAWAQEEQYREREVLDPSTDQWVAAPSAPQAESGPLAAARLDLVQDKPREARKLLENWLEANVGDDRYYEGVYLLGEAYFQLGDYWKAHERFDEAVENTAGELFNKALQRDIDVARAFLSGKRRILWKIFRIPAQDDGIEILDRVAERAPGTRLGEEALKLKADYFYENGDVDLAQDEYVALARDYPAGKYTALAMLRSAESAEAAFQGVAFSDAPLIEAQERYLQVQDAYPVYAEREDVGPRLEGIRDQRAKKDLNVGQWYERTGQAGAAAYYYRLVLHDYPKSIAAADAQVRLRGLGFEAPEDTQ